MLRMLTTEDFASWYAALDDAAAEDVAAALDVLQALGPERSPPESSELVLWYQSPAHAGWVDRFYDSQIAQFALRSRRALAHLHSPGVQRRLAALSSEQALRASVALERIAGQARRWRRGFASSHGEEAERALQESYGAVLDALGVAQPADDPAPGLRELTIKARGMRVLYGVEPKRERALIMIGETLDKQAYGPSVRRALALWREFLESGDEARSYQLQVGSER